MKRYSALMLAARRSGPCRPISLAYVASLQTAFCQFRSSKAMVCPDESIQQNACAIFFWCLRANLQLFHKQSARGNREEYSARVQQI